MILVQICSRINQAQQKEIKLMINLEQIKPNFTKLNMNELSIWFSYETPIAFSSFGQIFIRQNDWSSTTGKHLNYINTDKKLRLTGEHFEKLLNHNIIVTHAPVKVAS